MTQVGDISLVITEPAHSDYEPKNGVHNRNVLITWNNENPKDFHYLMLSAHSDSANPSDLRNRNVLVRARLLFQ